MVWTSNEKSVDELRIIANRVRRTAIEMGYKAGANGAHFGAGLSAVEILTALYCGVARVGADVETCDRDRILISKAHCVLALYPILKEKGFLSEEDLSHFEENGYSLPGHALKNEKKGVEFAAGSLGIAPSVACGMALDAQNSCRDNQVYVLLGDGECEEGAVWEAFMFAAHKRLNNLCFIIDNNSLQYDGNIEDIGGLTLIADKCRAFGLGVIEIDGHNLRELCEAFIKFSDKPKIIIAHTIKGKGVSFMENNPQWHHGTLSESQYRMAVEELDCAGCK